MGSNESTLQRYIDSKVGELTENQERLRDLLKNKSVDTRYELLINVRGVGQYGTWTGLLKATYDDDLENIKYMLDGFSIDQKYDVVKMQDSARWTALHFAALYSRTSIINYFAPVPTLYITGPFHP